MQLPDRDELRATLRTFDETRKKVVGGVLVVMLESPEKIRDREWIAEQFTQVALATGQFEEAGEAHEGFEAAQAWVRGNIDDVMNACFALFVHVAEDMRGKHGDGEFTAAEAMVQALGYFDE